MDRYTGACARPPNPAPPHWRRDAWRVRRFLQWYSAYYGISLPNEMTPTHREGAELREKYDIAGKGRGEPKPRKLRTLSQE